MDFNFAMSDEALLSRLRNEEDNFVERKTVADQSDVLRVAVSFANSAPIGMPCVLFLGVKNDGTCEDRNPKPDLDDLQIKVNRKLKHAYPRVPYMLRVLQTGPNQVLAVVVFGSELRPHFAGASFVRRGSETVDATQEQLNLLIAQRSSKVYRLSAHIGKQVTLSTKRLQGDGTFKVVPEAAMITDCNESWVTVERYQLNPPDFSSFPLERVDLSFDNKTKRLELYVTRDRSL